MKKIFLPLFIIIQLLGSISCKKEQTLLSPNPTVNTSPKADAGQEIIVIFPNSETELLGSYSDAENNVKDFKWTKISGPGSYKLVNENAQSTRLEQLQKGVYQFELTVTDRNGLSDKDIVKVIVGEIPASPNEKILTDQKWTVLMLDAVGGPDTYNIIEIKQFPTIVPPNTVYQVYVRRDNSSDWIPATRINTRPAGLYSNIFESRPDAKGKLNYGSLYIFNNGADASDEPDVKIVY